MFLMFKIKLYSHTTLKQYLFTELPNLRQTSPLQMQRLPVTSSVSEPRTSASAECAPIVLRVVVLPEGDPVPAGSGEGVLMICCQIQSDGTCVSEGICCVHVGL